MSERERPRQPPWVTRMLLDRVRHARENGLDGALCEVSSDSPCRRRLGARAENYSEAELTRAASAVPCDCSRGLCDGSDERLSEEALVEAVQRMTLEDTTWVVLRRCFQSPVLSERHEGVKHLRMLLSADPASSVLQEALDQGVVPYLVDILAQYSRGDHSDDALLFEAAWALTNLAAGTEPQTEVVVRAGAIPLFVELLEHPRETLREQALWGLGNIAGGSVARFRDEILHWGFSANGGAAVATATTSRSREVPEERGTTAEQSPRRRASMAIDDAAPECEDALPPCEDAPPPCARRPPPSCMLRVVAACQKSQRITTLRTAVWSVVNLCRGTPPPALALVAPAVPYLASLVASASDVMILRDALWALEGISGVPGGTATLVRQSVVPFVVRMLAHTEDTVCRPALRIVGQLANGTADDTQDVLDHGALPCLVRLLLNSTRKTTRKDVCWILSNIAAGTPNQLESMLLEPGLVQLLVAVLLHDPEPDVRKEAAWALCNASSFHPCEERQRCIAYSFLEPVSEILVRFQDPKLLEAALDALDRLLYLGEQLGASASASPHRLPRNMCVEILQRGQGFAHLKDLYATSAHLETMNVWKRSRNLIQTWFPSVSVS